MTFFILTVMTITSGIVIPTANLFLVEGTQQATAQKMALVGRLLRAQYDQ